MTELEDLMLILELSVQKNGEKPLTNKWLLNIIKMSLKQREEKEMNYELSSFDPNWD